MSKRNHNYEICHKPFLHYVSEEVPPARGPQVWYRPSDKAHFCRETTEWVQYNPVHLVCRLKVGETIRVFIPNP